MRRNHSPPLPSIPLVKTTKNSTWALFFSSVLVNVLFIIFAVHASDEGCLGVISVKEANYPVVICPDYLHFFCTFLLQSGQIAAW